MSGSTWPTLAAGNRAKASEVENKFDWIEQDFVPMSAGTKADASYDLGSATFRWRDGYFSRNLIHGAGSVSAPSLAKSGDPDTGVWYPNDNTWAVSTAGNEAMRISPDGEITKPLQPAFLAYNSATDASQTGAGTTSAVEFDTEVYDQNSDFNNTTDTFTAPVTGRYLLTAQIEYGNMTLAGQAFHTLILTSNRTYARNVDSTADISGRVSFNMIVIADMDAGDTATVTGACSANNPGGGVASFNGDSQLPTFFSGCLLA